MRQSNVEVFFKLDLFVFLPHMTHYINYKLWNEEFTFNLKNNGKFYRENMKVKP